MNKAFPIIIFVVAFGIVLYTLPQFAAYFGFNLINQAKLSPVVFLSEDNGQTFSETYWAGTSTPTVYDFEVDVKDSSFVYAATDRGFFMSRDFGAHWYPYYDLEGQLSRASVYQIQRAVSEPDRFFISFFKNGQGGIYQTDDRFFTLKKIFDTKEAVAYKLTASGDNLYLGLSDGRLISFSLDDSGFRLLASLGTPITDVFVEGVTVYAATKSKQVWKGNVYGGDFAILPEIQPSQSAYTSSLLGADLSTVVAKNPIKTILPDSQGKIYLAAADKLYRSANAGRNWQLLLDAKGRQISSINLGGSGRIIVGTGDKNSL